MKLSQLRSHIRSPAERERKQIAVSKFLYLLLLVGIVVFLLRLGAHRAFYIEGKGFIRGEKVAVQALNRGRVRELRRVLHDPVTAGDVVAVLEGAADAGTPREVAPDNERLRLQNEERRLLARWRDERERKLAAVEDRQHAVGRDLRKVRERLQQVESRLELESRLREAKEAEAARWKRLYELEAITQVDYLRHAQEPQAGPDPELLAELDYLRGEQGRLLGELETMARARGDVRGERETEARLRAVREQLAVTRPAPPPTQATTIGGEVLRAPIGGVLVTQYRRVGEVLLPGEALGEIVDTRAQYVEAFFAAEHEEALVIGRPVLLEFPSGDQGEGRVEAVDSVVTPVGDEYQKLHEPKEKLLRVRIRLQSPERYAQTLDSKVRVRIPRFAF